MRIQSGGGDRGSGLPPPPLKNHKTIGFLSNSGPDPLKNHAATKPAFNAGLTSARQRAVVLMMAHFKWHLDPPTPNQLKKLKKKLSKLDPL